MLSWFLGLGRNGPLQIHPVERLGVDTITRRARKVLTKDGLKGSSNADQTTVSFPTEQHLIQCPALGDCGAIQQLLQDQFVPYINPAEALGHIQRRNIGHKAHAPGLPGALAKYWRKLAKSKHSVIVVLWQNIASERIDWMWAWRPRERLAKKPILGLLAMSG